MNLDNSLFHNSSMDKSEENMLDLTNNSYDNIDMMNNIKKRKHFVYLNKIKNIKNKIN